MNDYAQTTMRSIKIINQAQGSVSTRTIESPSIPIMDSIRVIMNIRKVKTYWSKMVYADKTGVQNFSDAKAEIEEINKVAKDFYEVLGNNGKNIASLDMDKLQNNLFDENELMDGLLEKLSEDKKLSDSERHILSYYIKHQVLDDKQKDNIDLIIHSINKNPEKVREHINDDVLQTEASLYEEILMTEMYLFADNQQNQYSDLSKEERAHLTAYLESLHNFRNAIDEMKDVDGWLGGLTPDDPLLAVVEQYDYNKPNQPQAFYVETNIRIGMFPADESYGRKEFSSDNDIGSRYFKSEIRHYESGDDLARENNLIAREDYANHTSDFIGDQVTSIGLSVLTRANPVASISKGVIETLSNAAADKSDKELRMTEGDAQLAANDFNMEVQILEGRSMQPGQDQYEIKFVPSNETHAIMDRWKEVVDSGSDIPYPAEHISEENWFSISDFYHTNQTEMKDSFQDEYEYIFGD